MKLLNPKIRQKFAESLKAVLPVVGIVIVLSFTIAPITSSILLCFLVGAVMVMAGMMFFTLGAEMSMTPMGEKVGARMTQSKNILLIVVLSFLLGVVITISEPDADPGSGSGRGNLPGHCPSAYADRCGTAAVVNFFLHSSVRSCISRTGELSGSGV